MHTAEPRRGVCIVAASSGSERCRAGHPGGCSAAVGTVAPPDVSSDALDAGGWERADRSEETVFSESYGPVEVAGKAVTLTYRNAELAAAVAEDTGGRVDATLGVFTASHINFDPPLNDLPGTSAARKSSTKPRHRPAASSAGACATAA